MTDEEIAARAKAIRTIGDTFAVASVETEGKYGSPLLFVEAMTALGVTLGEVLPVARQAQLDWAEREGS